MLNIKVCDYCCELKEYVEERKVFLNFGEDSMNSVTSCYDCYSIINQFIDERWKVFYRVELIKQYKDKLL